MCEHLRVKVEPVWDYESDQILVIRVCKDCKIVKVGETWAEYFRRSDANKQSTNFKTV